MKTLLLLSQKGGAGKTTLASNLAVAAVADRHTTAIIDLDPQASATGWGDSRGEEAPTVVSIQPARLGKVLDTAQSQGVNLAILDTAPHSENAALTAARAADLILIPCRPAIFDLRAIENSIDIIKLAGKEKSAFIVFNATPPKGNLTQDAIAAVSHYGCPVCPVHVVERVDFVHSLTGGQAASEYQPKGKAAAEIQQLYKWLKKQL